MSLVHRRSWVDTLRRQQRFVLQSRSTSPRRIGPYAWEEIDGALGELSQFHDTFGFYVQGLEIEAATLPDGWNQRCVDVRGSDRAVGHCLEAHDLALSKLAAFREKDLTFVRTLIIEGLVHSTVLLDRLETMTITPPDRKSVIERWIKATARELPRRPR